MEEERRWGCRPNRRPEKGGVGGDEAGDGGGEIEGDEGVGNEEFGGNCARFLPEVTSLWRLPLRPLRLR